MNNTQKYIIIIAVSVVLAAVILDMWACRHVSFNGVVSTKGYEPETTDVITTMVSTGKTMTPVISVIHSPAVWWVIVWSDGLVRRCEASPEVWVRCVEGAEVKVHERRGYVFGGVWTRWVTIP